jgi:2-methylcitrate dehydratase PrpD
VLARRVTDFRGTPERALDRAEMREKFLMLTRHCPPQEMDRMFDRLQNLEHETDLDWIRVERR